MDRTRTTQAITLALRVGEVMLESSISVTEVDLVLRKLTRALGLQGCQVSVTLNQVTLSYLPADLEPPITVMSSVDLGEPRLHRLTALHDLVRRIERDEVTLADADHELSRIARAPDPTAGWIRLAAAAVSVAGWVVFAGGGPMAALAGVMAAIVVVPFVAGAERTRVPTLFVLVAAAVLIVAVPYGLTWAGASFQVQATVAGGLYILLPGAALVSSVSDGISGAPISGVAKALQAFVTAAALAVGVLVALKAAEQLGIVPAEQPERWPIPVTAVGAGVALAGFAISRSAPIRSVAPVALLGMAAWAVAYLRPFEDVTRDLTAFAAAVGIGVGGRLLARAQRLPLSVYTGIAIYVLVPGIAIYSAMVAYAQGAPDVGGELALRAVRVAVAIAAGTALGVAVGGAVPDPRPHVRPLARRRSRPGPARPPRPPGLPR